MKRTKLLVLSLLALIFGAPIGFSTANAKPPKVLDPNVANDQPPDETSEVGLLIKGAGVDYKDVLWRIRAGLSPKQAVEVAAAEKRENAGEKPAAPVPPDPNASASSAASSSSDAPADLDKKTVPQLKKLAAARNVDVTPDMKKADIIAAIEGAGTE